MPNINAATVRFDTMFDISKLNTGIQSAINLLNQLNQAARQAGSSVGQVRVGGGGTGGGGGTARPVDPTVLAAQQARAQSLATQAANQAAASQIRLQNAQNRQTAAAQRATGANQGLNAGLQRQGETLQSIFIRWAMLEHSIMNVVLALRLAMRTVTMFDADVIKVGTEFNKMMAMVNTVAKYTPEKMDQARNAVLDLANTTTISADTIARGFYSVVSATGATGQEMEILKAANRDAVSGFTSVDTAAKALSVAMNVYGDSVSGVNEVSDIMFKMVEYGIAPYEEFAGVLGLVVNTGKMAGQSLSTVAGALAFLNKEGISAQRSATYLNQVFRQLFGKQERIVSLKNILGIDVWDEMGNFRDLVDIVKDIAAATKGMSEATRNVTLRNIFPDSREQMGLATMINNVKELERVVTGTANSGEASMEAFGRATDYPGRRLEVLINQWKTFKVELSTGLLNSISPVVEMLGKMADNFHNLTPASKEAAGGFAALSTGVLAALTSFGMLTWAFVKTKATFQVMNAVLKDGEAQAIGMATAAKLLKFAFSWWGAAIAAVALALGGLLIWQKKVKEEQERAVQTAANVAQKTKEETIQAQALVGKYKELSEKANKSAGEKQTLYNISNKLVGLLPDLNFQLDQEGRYVFSLTDLYGALNSKLGELLVKEREHAAILAEKARQAKVGISGIAAGMLSPPPGKPWGAGNFPMPPTGLSMQKYQEWQNKPDWRKRFGYMPYDAAAVVAAKNTLVGKLTSVKQQLTDVRGASVPPVVPQEQFSTGMRIIDNAIARVKKLGTVDNYVYTEAQENVRKAIEIIFGATAAQEEHWKRLYEKLSPESILKEIEAANKAQRQEEGGGGGVPDLSDKGKEPPTALQNLQKRWDEIGYKLEAMAIDQEQALMAYRNLFPQFFTVPINVEKGENRFQARGGALSTLKQTEKGYADKFFESFAQSLTYLKEEDINPEERIDKAKGFMDKFDRMLRESIKFRDSMVEKGIDPLTQSTGRMAQEKIDRLKKLYQEAQDIHKKAVEERDDLWNEDLEAQRRFTERDLQIIEDRNKKQQEKERKRKEFIQGAHADILRRQDEETWWSRENLARANQEFREKQAKIQEMMTQPAEMAAGGLSFDEQKRRGQMFEDIQKWQNEIAIGQVELNNRNAKAQEDFQQRSYDAWKDYYKRLRELEDRSWQERFDKVSKMLPLTGQAQMLEERIAQKETEIRQAGGGRGPYTLEMLGSPRLSERAKGLVEQLLKLQEALGGIQDAIREGKISDIIANLDAGLTKSLDLMKKRKEHLDALIRIDLKKPVRPITSLAGLMLAQQQENLPRFSDEAQRAIQRIQKEQGRIAQDLAVRLHPEQRAELLAQLEDYRKQIRGIVETETEQMYEKQRKRLEEYQNWALGMWEGFFGDVFSGRAKEGVIGLAQEITKAAIENSPTYQNLMNKLILNTQSIIPPEEAVKIALTEGGLTAAQAMEQGIVQGGQIAASALQATVQSLNANTVQTMQMYNGIPGSGYALGMAGQAQGNGISVAQAPGSPTTGQKSTSKQKNQQSMKWLTGASAALSIYQNAQGASTLEATLGGAATGFMIGGPVGAAIGGLIGLFGSKKKSQKKATWDQLLSQFYQPSNVPYSEPQFLPYGMLAGGMNPGMAFHGGVGQSNFFNAQRGQTVINNVTYYDFTGNKDRLAPADWRQATRQVQQARARETLSPQTTDYAIALRQGVASVR